MVVDIKKIREAGPKLRTIEKHKPTKKINFQIFIVMIFLKCNQNVTKHNSYMSITVILALE